MRAKKAGLIVDNPIDIISMIALPAIAIMALFNLSVAFSGSEEFPAVTPACYDLIQRGILGLGGMVFTKWLFQSKRAKAQLIGVSFNTDDLLDIGYCVVAYFGIQAGVLFLRELYMFQVTASDVWLFFVSAAIIEEALYRGFLVMLIQAVMARLLGVKAEKNLLIPNGAAIVISAAVFAWSHEAYREDPFLITLTFLGGCSQAYFYIKTKNLLGPMVAHGLINFSAAGSLIQTLNIPQLIENGGLIQQINMDGGIILWQKNINFYWRCWC